MTDQTSTLTFRAGLAIRFLDACFTLILRVIVSMLVILFSVGLGAGAVKAGLPKSLATGSVVVGILLLLRLCWQAPASRLYSSLVLHPEYLRIGSGILRRDVPYEEIDEVSVLDRSPTESWISIRCGSTRTPVVLSRHDAQLSFEVLTRVCPYAIFVDSKGKVYARPQTDRPERTLLAYERWQRRKAFSSLLAAMFFFSAGTVRSWLALQWLQGNIAPATWPEIVLLATGPFMLFGAVVLARYAWRSWNDARRTRGERYDLAARAFPLNDPPKPARGASDAGS